jgi:phosphoribosyl 1,2-cyclic phosphodiesterase
VECDGVRVGVFTDIGTVCEKLTAHFSQCHAAFLEANYDEEMLENGRYPVYLKNRIRSEHGHLSNAQALELFIEHRSEFLSHLLLAHLSKENNSPELVEQLFTTHAGSTNIIVASRYEESPVYRVGKSGVEEETDLRGQFALQL